MLKRWSTLETTLRKINGDTWKCKRIIFFNSFFVVNYKLFVKKNQIVQRGSNRIIKYWIIFPSSLSWMLLLLSLLNQAKLWWSRSFEIYFSPCHAIPLKFTSLKSDFDFSVDISMKLHIADKLSVKRWYDFLV